MNTTTKTDWKRLSTMSDSEIDFSDIPELGEAFFDNARLKTLVTLHLDAEVVEWYKAQASDYPSLINSVLARYVTAQTEPKE